MRIESVDFRFFHLLSFEKLYIEDQQGDTLLYAGSALVRLNDWFFLKDKIELHYIGLEDGKIQMQRKNSIWNYQYILDKLKQSDTSRQSSEINLDLDRIELTNIRFNMLDKWIGQDMLASVGHLDARLDSVDINRSTFRIRKLTLDRPVFSMLDYKGSRTDAEAKALKSKSTSSPSDIDLFVNTLTIENGKFSNDDPDAPASISGLFDEWHMRFDSLQATISDLQFKNDELNANVKLSANERCGFKIRKLQADMRFNNRMMEFKKLLIQTDKSKIGDYYAMRYKEFNNDMKDFITRVGLDGRIKNSLVHSDDIAYFAPELADWHRVFIINGNASGTLDDFNIRNMKATSGSTAISGDLKMQHMDNLDQLQLNFQSKQSSTNYADLAWLIPSLRNTKPVQLQSLGQLVYTGNFSGTLQNFTTEGTIITALGGMDYTLAMNIPAKGEVIYDAGIKTNQFDLGKLIGDSKIGMLAISGTVSGKGLNWKTMDTRFDLDIPKLGYQHYVYQQTKASGSMRNGELKTKMSIRDTNLTISELDATCRFNANQPGFSIYANLQQANFRALNWLDRDVELAGRFNIDFKGIHIDSLEGIAQLDEIRLMHRNERIPMNRVVLSAYQDQKGRNVRLISDQFEAGITGRYKILELPDAFLAFLNNYYPSYIPKPTRQLENQELQFDLKTRDVTELLKLIDPAIEGGNDANIQARLNVQQTLFSLKASIPNLGYNEKSVQGFRMNSIGNLDTLQATVDVDQLKLNDALEFPSTSLTFSSSNDKTNLQLKTAEGTLANQIDLNARIQTFDEGALIHFNPSSFYLNDKRWDIESDGEVSIHRKKLHVERFSLTHNQERFSLSTELNEETNETTLRANIDQVNLEDFLPIFFKDPEISGKLTGTATLSDPFQKNKLDFIGKIDSVQIERQYIGGLLLNSQFRPEQGVIDYYAKSTDTVNQFEINGRYQLQDTGLQQMMTTLTGEKINLRILQPYLSDVFSELDGVAKTNLTWSGNDEHAYLTGSVLVENGQFKVDYTQVRYFLKNQPIIFEKDAIRLNMIQLRDSLNNTATCSGVIQHRLFDDFNFKNIRLESSRLALLNTTKSNNAQFYGQAIGKATMSLNGPLQDLKLVLNAEPMSIDTSHIFLNISDEKESKSTDYIEFVEIGEYQSDVKKSDDLNIQVTVNVKANPACKVDVILDEETGDVIKGQGTGNISVSIGNIEPLKIRGNYELTRGEYTFNFQTYFQKPFVLNRGSINWNGDPFQAIINIDAAYQAKNVDISSLATSGGFMQKEDVTIVAHLTGVLQSPTVKFDITLPEQSEARRNDVIVKRLADFKNDDNEMNKQVASLLLFNTFLIGNQNFLSQGNASTLFTNTIGGVVSNLLTNFFNRELEKATKGVLSTYININPTLDLQQNASQLQANIRAGLKILLDKRLVMLVGGNLDYNNPIYTQQLERRGLLTPDITIEWMINRDGSLRIVGFNRSSIDFSLSQRNRSGLRLSYRKDFNRLADLFSGKKK